MEEIGTVIEFELKSKHIVKVAIADNSTCHKCEARAFCNPNLEKKSVFAWTEIELKENDKVLMLTPGAKGIFFASLLLFVMPVAIVIAFFALLTFKAHIKLLMGFGAMGIYLFFLLKLDKYLIGKQWLLPKIIKKEPII